jgi:hypothetical protein
LIWDKLRKDRTLINEGGFSLLKSSGTPSGHAVGTPLSNKWATNPSISSAVKATGKKRRVRQIVIKVAFSVKREYKDVTEQRITGRIGQPGGFKRQSFPVTKGANPPKIKFFDAVACLEPGLAQLSDAPNQSG